MANPWYFYCFRQACPSFGEHNKRSFISLWLIMRIVPLHQTIQDNLLADHLSTHLNQHESFFNKFTWLVDVMGWMFSPWDHIISLACNGFNHPSSASFPTTMYNTLENTVQFILLNFWNLQFYFVVYQLQVSTDTLSLFLGFHFLYSHLS